MADHEFGAQDKAVVSEDKMGDSETFLVHGMSRSAAIHLIGRIAHAHHLDVRIKMRGLGDDVGPTPEQAGRPH